MKKTKFTLKILFSVFILLNTSFAQPSWVWQNPLPTGNNLNSVYFLDANTGFTGGSSGTLLKTTNGGTSWDALQTGTTEQLNSIYFINSSTGFIAAGFNTRAILKTTNGGLNWTQQILGSPFGLKSLHFANASTGMMAGYLGVIYLTTNGGANWNSISTSVSNLQAVFMASAATVYAAGSTNIVKSTNGGLNWTTQSSGTSNSINGLYFIDTLTGFAVGYNGTILKTINGGTNWITVTSGGNSAFYSVKFINPSTGFISGGSGLCLTTTNGGNNWTSSNVQAANFNDLYSIFPVSAATIYATGKFGTIIKTTNGGTNWTGLFNGVNVNLFSASFVDDNNVYACSNSKAVKTSNGGVNWIVLNQITSARAVYFINSNTGFITSYSNNTIQKTTNGGANWTALSTGLPYQYFTDIKFLNQNTGFLLGPAHQILRTTNGGTNWTLVDSAANSYLQYMSFSDSLNGYVAGYKSSPSGSLIKKTTNAGLNWVEITTPNTVSSLRTVQFLNVNTGYTVTNSGQFFRTSNGGASWDSLASVNTTTNDMYFINGNVGYVSGISGGLYRTTNGGQNFTQLPVPSLSSIYRIYFNNVTGVAYLIGEGGMILKSTNGTVTGINQTGINEPVSYSMIQNYPNPFNPSTRIKFALPYDAKVKLSVYDINGKEIAVLLNGMNKEAGAHEEEFNASNLSSGVYFYKLEYDSKHLTGKMILIK